MHLTGVYEIQQFQYGFTRLQDVATSVQAMERPNASLIGSFYTLIGQQCSGKTVPLYHGYEILEELTSQEMVSIFEDIN